MDPIDDNTDSADIEIDVSLAAASIFVDYLEDSKTFEIIEGLTDDSLASDYQIKITLSDEENKTTTGTFTLTIEA